MGNLGVGARDYLSIYYHFLGGSIVDLTGGSSFFFACAALPLPPVLAGLNPNAAKDPENTDAMNVGSKSKIF